ncbi:MAG: putative methyl-accepting chemotaxis protein YoaH [Pelotomaculum sp. PtaU1.Bin035]|nr:MAG: putative methyl-accepting chemotaxis protein YoaH [Pelotomaculum sp. PtaU1.Bin035]
MQKEDKDRLTAYTINELYQNIDPITSKISELIDLQLDIAKSEYDKAENVYNTTWRIAIASIILGILLALILAYLIVRSIAEPVNLLQKELNALAEKGGDLTQEINIKSKDEVGLLAGTVNKFLANLRTIMVEVNNNSKCVAETAQQLNLASQQTAAGANETAATMGEISTTVEQVASNAQTISQVSQSVAGHADEGDKGIARVTEQMKNIVNSTKEVTGNIDELNKKIKEINQIVELITNIADQTNLLALNAAIEAARAGEQGLGFAVVAEEVRKLAEQSAIATKDINSLIEAIQYESGTAVKSIAESGKNVEEGTRIVQEVSANFKEIIGAVQGLTEQIQDVATATEQMSSGVQNVAASTEEQTAAMEEVSASAESLSKLSDELNTLVGKFKV